MDYSERRVTRLRAAMVDAGVDVAYIRNTSNIRWLTNFADVFDSEPAHGAIITAHQAVVHSDSRYSIALRNCAKGSPFEINDEAITHAKLLARMLSAHEGFAPQDGGEQTVSVLVEDSLTIHEYNVLQETLKEAGLLGGEGMVALYPESNFVEAQRQQKDQAEVDAMRQAQAITDAGFAHIIEYMQPGMTELEVQRELDRFMLDAGADGLSFDTIVATGAHGASPHARPSHCILREGDAVVMDFGARKGDYCSDMTRTVFMGQPSSKLQASWIALRDANETCASRIKPGVIASEVHKQAEAILAEHGFGGCMGHSLGHGVGIDIHEQPNLARSNNNPLQVGNVVTVEPGIYIEGEFGMRLEDFGVVTETGFNVFTKSPHDMVIIEHR